MSGSSLNENSALGAVEDEKNEKKEKKEKSFSEQARTAGARGTDGDDDDDRGLMPTLSRTPTSNLDYLRPGTNVLTLTRSRRSGNAGGGWSRGDEERARATAEEDEETGGAPGREKRKASKWVGTVRRTG